MLALPTVGILAACGANGTATSATSTVAAPITSTAAPSAAATTAASTAAAAAPASTASAAQTAAAAGSAPVTGPKAVLHYEPWPIAQATHGGPVGYKHLMDDFNAAKPGGYTVSVVTPPGKNFYEALQVAVAGGSSPDTFQEDLGPVAIYGMNGVATALDSYVARDKFDLSQLFPFSVEMMKWDGKIYSMMQHTDIVFNWYNTDLLQQAGLDPTALPKTWDELEQLAAKGIKKNGEQLVQIGYSPEWQVPFLLSNGVKLFADGNRKVAFNTPAGVETLDWWKKMINVVNGGQVALNAYVKAEGATKNGSTFGPFETSRQLAKTNGNWEADAMRRAGDVTKFSVGPLPSGPSGAKDNKGNVYMGGIFCALSATGKNKEGGWEFLKFLAGPVGGVAVETGTADVSGNMAASKNPTVLSDPENSFGRKEALPLFPVATATRDVPGPVSNKVGGFLGSAFDSVVKNKMDATTALKQAEQLSNAALDTFFSNVKQ